mgnify:CR=1 FL=1
MKKIAILGSTGSIGTQTLDVVRANGDIEVLGISAGRNVKMLEEQGVEIRTCGTCLNFYGISDKLQVGEVTNMYDIVETMAKASKVIKP